MNSVVPTHQKTHIALQAQAIQQQGSLLEKLQTTLELDKLLFLFAEEVQKQLHIDYLVFAGQEQVITLLGQLPLQPMKGIELVADEQHLGHLTFGRKTPLELAEKKLIHRLTQNLVYPLKNALLFAQVKQQSLKDALTGIGNRHALVEHIEQVIAYQDRFHHSDELVLIDLDGFKQINDTHGHLVGDHILQQFTQVVLSVLRAHDGLYRYGGDEFVLLLKKDKYTTTSAAQQVFQRIQDKLNQSELYKQHQLGCSAGAVTITSDYQKAADVLEAADCLLYQAKRAGKNILRE